MTSGYVYVILLRECISQQLHIFKIGRTTDIFSRYKAYPKGSKILFVHYVDNYIEAETDILQALKASPHIEQKMEFGSEYFQGPFLELSRIVYDCSISAREKNADTHYLFRYARPSQNVSEQAKVSNPPSFSEQAPRPKSIYQHIKDFLDEKKDVYQGKVVKLNVLYDALCVWLQETNRPHASQTQLSRCIKHKYDIVHKSHRFPDGIHQAYDFTLDERVTYENFVRFVKENFRKNARGFFTLQQAKKAYMEKEYCSFQFKHFKENLEQQLDTLCHDRKCIKGKIWHSVFVGYEIGPVTRTQDSDILQSWISETLEITQDPRDRVKCADIFLDFKQFAAHDAASKMDPIAFGKRFRSKTGLESIVYNKCRYYKGVKMRTDDEDDAPCLFPTVDDDE